DNLETLDDTANVLELFRRVCSPPLQKALITTRRFPAAPPPGFSRLALDAIRDTAACRKLVIDQLRNTFPTCRRTRPLTRLLRWGAAIRSLSSYSPENWLLRESLRSDNSGTNGEVTARRPSTMPTSLACAPMYLMPGSLSTSVRKDGRFSP